MTDDLTREVFGNLGETSKAVFYVLAFVASGVFAWGVWRRIKLWRRGRPDDSPIDWRAAFDNLRTRALAQRRTSAATAKSRQGHPDRQAGVAGGTA